MRYFASDIAFCLAVLLVVLVVLAILFGHFLPAGAFCTDGLDGVRGWAFHCYVLECLGRIVWCIVLCGVSYNKQIFSELCMYVCLRNDHGFAGHLHLCSVILSA